MSYEGLAALWCISIIIVFLIVFVFVASRNNEAGEGVLAGIVAVLLLLGFARLNDATFEGMRIAKLQEKQVYSTKAVYESEGASILYLSTESTNAYYKVICSDLRFGCPKPWPKFFRLERDREHLADEKYFIRPVNVPLVPDK